jgi:uncharacterized protein YbjT (DUF2867 family)
MTATPGTRMVTVFGGSGFLGRHVVRALANEGWRVRVAVPNPNTAHFLKPMGGVGQIQIVKANILDDNAVSAALTHADAAINLVGILAQSRRQRFDTIHVEGAARIARAAAAHGLARLVHVSALGTGPNVPSHYGRTKAEGEARVREAFPAATIVRPSVLFGPEDDLFNKFAWIARLAPVLPLIGGGKTRFQPAFVGDVAQAIAHILADPTRAGQIYEFGGPEVMSFKQILELVLKQTHRKRFLVPVPFGVMRLKGAFLGLLPNPLLTLDQVRMLETDNVVSQGALGLRDLGITPTAAEAIVPSYLWRFRKAGQFETAAS